jgi:hypothetical protein
MLSAPVIELTSGEFEQVVERLYDPELDIEAARLLVRAYDAYLMFAGQAPNLLALPVDSDASNRSYALMRKVGNAHVADLALAASLVDFASRLSERGSLSAPPEAIDAFTLFSHAFALVSDLHNRYELGETLPGLPSLDDAYEALSQAPVKAWLCRHHLTVSPPPVR